MTERFRVEKDFLGTMEISESAYYGIQSARAKDNFPITGIMLHSQLIIAIAKVKQAAAKANRDVGALKPEIAEAISKACQDIIEKRLHDNFIVDVIQGGAGTSINMNANEVIANRALEILGHAKGEYKIIHPNIHVNMSQSTNDVFPTAIKIASFMLCQSLLKVLKMLTATIKDKAEEFDEVLKMGRTHLQDAVPIRLGQEFRAWSRMLERDFQRIKGSMQELLEINLGATAVGTGLNADPKYTALVLEHLREGTKLDLLRAEDLIDATQNTDVYVEVSGKLKTLAGNLSKIANDLRLMSSGPRTGLNEINLPALQPGSSIMPGKVNPVIPEVVNQVAFQVAGNDQTISRAAEAGQLELNVMEPVMAFNLLQSLDILHNVIKVFELKCIRDITANKERCNEMVETSVGILTAINPHVGYEVASMIAKEAITTGRPIREIILEKGVLKEDELDCILCPFEMTEPGIACKELLEGKKPVKKQ